MGTQLQTDSVKIRYQLVDSMMNRSYRVAIFAIRDRDTVKLNLVQGAIGDSIQAGEHEVLWDARREWTRYRGTVRFELRALPNFSFVTPEEQITVRRAKGITLGWYGQNSTLDSIRIDLYRYDEFEQTVDRVKGRGDFAWRIPPKLALGEGYRVRLTNLDTNTKYGYSPYFTVDTRYPLWMKIAPPIAAVAGYFTWLALRLLPPPDTPTR
jgi:hypothetical protein